MINKKIISIIALTLCLTITSCDNDNPVTSTTTPNPSTTTTTSHNPSTTNVENYDEWVDTWSKEGHIYFHYYREDGNYDNYAS